ncbi:hypothetical protein [Streptomyces enissocaesilis]|uniref:Uncharacterized protein n=1 Tax=Streptomyces enissocaesilis TaxID=332589 RepID=A0ABP6K898_9ACTN
MVTVSLAIGLLALFFALAWFVAHTADSPPRLADVAPTAPPSPAADGSLPSQHRGGYDPNARLLGVLAIVTPLLTTIVGFYFGQRVGEAQGEATKQKAQKNQAQIISTLLERGQGSSVQALKARGLIGEPKKK